MGLVSSSVATSTAAKHRASWRHWVDFHRAHGKGWELLFPSELHVCLWLTYLHKKKLAFSTIKVYLYALSSEIKTRGGASIIKPHESWFIRATVRAIAKKVDHSHVVFRRPLTVPLLRKLVATCSLGEHDSLLYCAMLAVGVYGMFRINEVCHVGRGDTAKYIRMKDIVLTKDHIKVTIFKTKTAAVVHKVIASVSGQGCNPYELVRGFLNIKVGDVSPSAPLFATKNGRPVTRVMLVNFLQSKMKTILPDVDVKAWNGISLRKGGATSAMRAGVPGEVIQQLGHWKSSVYMRYISVDTDDIIKAQKKFS